MKDDLQAVLERALGMNWHMGISIFEGDRNML